MSIKIKDTTNCCVAAELYDFGGSANRGSDTAQNKGSMLDKIAELARDFRLMGYSLDRLAVVSAFITTAQTVAMEALDEIGFERTGPFSKTKHSESDLIVFTIHAPKLLEWSKAHLNKAKVRTTKVMGAPGPIPAAPVPVVVVDWDENFEEEDM